MELQGLQNKPEDKQKRKTIVAERGIEGVK